MLKAISYWSMKDGMTGVLPVDNALQVARSERFGALELAIGLSGELTPASTQAQCRDIRNLIDKSGIRVETIACGFTWAMNPASESATVRTQSIEAHQAAVERTAWLGAGAMLMVPGVVKSPIAPHEIIRYDRAIERVREAVAQVLDIAERFDVDLCIENVWNGLFYSPLEFIDFIDSFESDRLGAYLDVGNLIGYQQHPPDWIELLGKRIKRVHIKDCRASFGWTSTNCFCDLGAGDVPWKETLTALRNVGYDGTLVAEMLPWDPGLLARTSVAMDRLLTL